MIFLLRGYWWSALRPQSLSLRLPTLEQVATHEQELKSHGKDYEFHRYPNAGHGFFYYDRPPYRQEQAVDGWNKIWDFLGRHLSA